MKNNVKIDKSVVFIYTDFTIGQEILLNHLSIRIE